RRVEIAVPIVEEKPKNQLIKIIKVFSKDTENSYVMDSDGEYTKHNEKHGISAQQTWLGRLKWRKYIKTN
ncbi:hypothetical protein, partial [Clostridium botulinum]|uniref:hypothetical protein n=1 Tax=Clostridium botulinum TaxID=1491 RepID=UPI00217D51AC